jgi:hypothetical protein
MRWLIILAIVIGLVYLYWPEQAPKKKPVPESAPPPAPQAVQPAAAGPPPAPPAPAPPARPNPDLLARLNQAAREVGVQVRGVEPQPNGWRLLSIAWTGDNAALGGDFLERCQRDGIIRDFDVQGHYGQTTENDRRVFLAQFKVRF